MEPLSLRRAMQKLPHFRISRHLSTLICRMWMAPPSVKQAEPSACPRYSFNQNILTELNKCQPGFLSAGEMAKPSESCGSHRSYPLFWLDFKSVLPTEQNTPICKFSPVLPTKNDSALSRLLSAVWRGKAVRAADWPPDCTHCLSRAQWGLSAHRKLN